MISALRHFAGLGILCTIGVALSACDASNPCPGSAWSYDPAARACRAVTDAGTDSGVPLDASADTGMSASSLGATCTTATAAADCVVTATYCAQSPFDPSGYCTVRDCTLSPDDCPAGYRCTAAYVAFGAPQFCERIPDAGP